MLEPLDPIPSSFQALSDGAPSPIKSAPRQLMQPGQGFSFASADGRNDRSTSQPCASSNVILVASECVGPDCSPPCALPLVLKAAGVVPITGRIRVAKKANMLSKQHGSTGSPCPFGPQLVRPKALIRAARDASPTPFESWSSIGVSRIPCPIYDFAGKNAPALPYTGLCRAGPGPQPNLICLKSINTTIC